MLRVLRLHLKVAIFQPELWEHAPHTTSILKSYHGATARALRRARSPQRVARTAEIVKSPQFFDLDHANLRRGSQSRARIKLPPRRLRNLN